ncbi:VCBS domain-containing protein [Ruegeria atlantica]|uniref:VCBS domain-containing protein n=1 Tax=Ruegeria atlantica TaxID=81569 RepID=UPI002494729C|nr:VCBS domain-containing protein [Ruegeria atlantica]
MVSIVGTTTGFVTGDPPNVATGDLGLDGFPLSQNWTISQQSVLGVASIDPNTGEWTYTVNQSDFDDIPFGDIVTDTFTVQVTGLEFDGLLRKRSFRLARNIHCAVIPTGWDHRFGYTHHKCSPHVGIF